MLRDLKERIRYISYSYHSFLSFLPIRFFHPLAIFPGSVKISLLAERRCSPVFAAKGLNERMIGVLICHISSGSLSQSFRGFDRNARLL